AIGSVVDVVEVTDSGGGKATANVNVSAGVALSPATPSAPPRGAVAFSATGGAGAPYTWSLSANLSGGSINASTGAYTAGATGSVTDTVRAVDALGNQATVNVAVGAGVAINPAAPSVAPR